MIIAYKNKYIIIIQRKVFFVLNKRDIKSYLKYRNYINKMSYCRKNNLPVQVENLINHQINVELSASHVYLALYSFFMNDQQGYPGFAKFFKASSDEETCHAKRFIDYQNTRGGDVRILGIPNPQFVIQNNNRSIIYQAVEFALNLEQQVYDSILHIHNTSNDNGLQVFLDDFIKEQLEAQFELGTLLRKLERIGNDGHGLTQMDNEMVEKFK